ncbi:MarR family winged helix-turn-helix transcriptional regulator [Nitratireductor kimnyeongensis]|uniref:MarR family winged helix-turn-helix transcriptional regulator n=1 Tax=Nitratireductor kimnyeongensis TaxID=430679 RepID=A0ABW0T7U0_9HYPH|nr:MarR family transcriptional regulator [Nitratireductor kimnyeongensis]QZZ36167.1 MarR family transcriptional regulator [Nitratireductor kimnyeongensis]
MTDTPVPAEHDDALPQGEAEIGELGRQTGYLLRRASMTYTTHWMLSTRATSIAGLTPVQAGMLILIEENPGLTQIELARLLNVEGSTLWALVAKLREMGLVQRYRQPGDRRAFALHLTKQGKRALVQTTALLADHQEALLQRLTPDQRAQLNQSLKLIIAAGEVENQRLAEMAPQ